MSSADKNAALGWVSARHLQHMIARGEAAGVAVHEVLAAGGISRTDLADPDGLIPLTAIETMLAALARHYRDPLLGLHLASDIQPATLGVVGLVFQSCATLADALETVVRYNGLLSNIGATSLAFGPGTVEVRWECFAGGPNFRRQATEYVLGICVALSRLMLPARQQELLQAVHFAHEPPHALAAAREYFACFGAPVHFGKPHAALLFPASALHTRLQHSDTVLRELLERHARELLHRREQAASPVDAVRQLIRAMLLDGMPAKEAVAAQLGLSGRSLHRRLQEAGTSFQHLLDTVRLELAQQRLHASHDSLNLIADQLGFSSHQAFMRWFKQSTGLTPGEYRKHKDAAP